MPQFQGKDVSQTKVKFTGGAKELFTIPPKLDQIVKVEIEGRVSGVAHVVDESTGDLVEVVTVKVLDLNGVEVLALPGSVSTPGNGPAQQSQGQQGAAA